jgi:ketosteroid isomerase-like protein
MTTVDAGTANRIARDWLEAWNSHDAHSVVEPFAHDVTVTSPLVEVRRPGSRGQLKGRDNVLAYYEEGLALAPNLHFELIDVLRGVGRVTIVFRDHNQTLVAETLTLDEHGAVVAVQVSRGDAPVQGP